VPSPALVHPSELDSSRFDFAIGRATLAPGEAARAIEEAEVLALDMLIARCSAADLTLVAAVDAVVIGFSAFRLISHQEAQLVLGAVLPSAAGRQLYSRLTLAGGAWAGEQGRLSLLCVTQLGNLAAQRSWARVGLQPSAAFYTFHLWRR